MSSIISFVVLLSILVVVHEWGHYFVGRRAGVRVLRFSIGFGPELAGFTRNGTRYSLSLIPFGGFVKFAGFSEDDADTTGAPDEYLSRGLVTRSAIILAGPAMNYLLAILIYAAVFAFLGVEVITTTRIGQVAPDSRAEQMGVQADDVLRSVNGVAIEDWGGFSNELAQVEAGERLELEVERGGELVRLEGSAPDSAGFRRAVLGVSPFGEAVIGYVRRGGPAWNAGLRSGDRIVSLDGQNIDRWSGMRQIILEHPGEELAIVWEHEGRTFDGTITPKEIVIEQTGAEPDTVGQVGVQQAVARRKLNFGAALLAGWQRTWWLTERVVSFVPSIPRTIYNHYFKGERTDGLGGPVRLAQLSGEAAQWGLGAFLSLMALLSCQLAIFNLLPIPVLDGGHLALHVIEVLTRRPPTPRVKLALQQLGFAIIILLMLSVTVMDITRLFG